MVSVLAGVRDREGVADALADHPGLAGGDVAAGSGVDHEVAGQSGADVLDLADDAQPVLAVQVELGDLGTVVLHLEGQVAGADLGARDVAAVVGRRHADRAVGIGRGVVGLGETTAGGQHERCGRTERKDEGDAHGCCLSGSVCGRHGLRRRRGGGTVAPDPREEEGQSRHDVRDPGDRLEPGGGGREVDGALEDGPAPGRGRDLVADVEGQVVEPGQDAAPPAGRVRRRRGRRRRRRSGSRRSRRRTWRG